MTGKRNSRPLEAAIAKFRRVPRDSAIVTHRVNVDDTVEVFWSNGAGKSVYQVRDTEKGPHEFVVISEVEFGNNGREIRQ
jgi:hypothetical protein